MTLIFMRFLIQIFTLQPSAARASHNAVSSGLNSTRQCSGANGCEEQAAAERGYAERVKYERAERLIRD